MSDILDGLEDVVERNPRLDKTAGEYLLEVAKIGKYPSVQGKPPRFQGDFKVLESSNNTIPPGANASHLIWQDMTYDKYHKAPIANMLKAIMGADKVTAKEGNAAVATPEVAGTKVRLVVSAQSKTKKDGTVSDFFETNYFPVQAVAKTAKK